MIAKRITHVVLAATATAALLSPSTRASLNIDVRATHLNGLPLSGGNTTKLVTARVNDLIAFDVFAVVTGTNANLSDDKFVHVLGSFRSSFGPTGNLLMDIVRSEFDDNGEITTAGFDGQGSSVGLQQDLDSDGDLDVGSNSQSDHAHFWAARYAFAPAGADGAGSTNATTGGRRIGFGTFLVTNHSFSPTHINFAGRPIATGAMWIQDGVRIQEASLDGLAPITVITVPEPIAAGFGFAGLIGLFRRRSRHRID